ncbi:hypothetical protein NVS55_08465 [Myxococcus stipitatus]|uniref:hypothetical protein n=1 Tax=Myxococcus stipitatus TaxID=83455 RepID=UPI003144F2B8
MTPRQAEELLSHLKLKALGLDELHERVRLSGSAWTRDQLELFLLCARGVTRDGTGGFHAIAASAEDDLGAAIVAAVRSFAGKPVPAAQVRARLPQHFVTTDEQVLAVARRTAGLEVFGPKLIRIAP